MCFCNYSLYCNLSSIDDYNFAFSKKNIVKINLTDLAYSFSNKQADHNSVTFYKSFVGTRGQMVYKKVTEVIGINYTLSWKKQQVNEIQSVLSDLGIQQRVADNDDLFCSFRCLYIISNHYARPCTCVARFLIRIRSTHVDWTPKVPDSEKC